MYRVVRASTLYYENYMRQSKARYELIKPFMLLVDSARFRDSQKSCSMDYLNLCDIIYRMRELYSSGEPLYHHFGMLMEELQILGFNINSMKISGTTDEGKLKDQIDLLLQFLAFRYPFDEFDNKVGIHDIDTDRYVFIQP